jgi:hypothetical protein
MICFLKIKTALIIAVAALLSATVVEARPANPNGKPPVCPPAPPLSVDGGFYNLTLKYVQAEIKTADLAEVVNEVADHGTSGNSLNNPQFTRCTAVAQIFKVSPSAVAGKSAITLRITGSCTDYEDFQTSLMLELNTMKSMIEDLAKLPIMVVDPSWQTPAPCVDGGLFAAFRACNEVNW